MAVPASAANQIRNNRETAGRWELYAGHREQLGALITATRSSSAGGRLCVLGAGNANDLDLERLACAFAEVHLVDVDPDALGRALARQAATRARLFAHAPVDVSGVLADLPRWRGAAATPAELSGIAQAVALRLAACLPGPFDLVVSDCMLSQIHWTCYEALGKGPLLGAVASAALEAHLTALATLAAPGAPCLLVTDTISSETFPLEEIFPTREPLELLGDLARQGALFTGTSPALVLPRLRREPLARLVEAPGLVRPWLWRLDSERTVMVYGVAFRRRAACAS